MGKGTKSGIKDRITRWHPFRYQYTDYEGRQAVFTFTCQKCGGHSCDKIDSLDHDVFWSGHYRCSDCGCTQEDGHEINYYSDCFHKYYIKEQPIQLDLFKQ